MFNADLDAVLTSLDLKVKSITSLLPLFHMLFDASLDNVVVYSASGDTVYVNPNLLKTIHISSVNEKTEDITVEECFSQYKDASHSVLQTGVAKDLVIKIIHPKLSRVIHDLVCISPIKNNKNQIIGAIATGRDLDFYEQQKNLEVVKQEHYLRALLDTFPFIVWMKDKENRYITCNRAFAKVAGTASTDVLEGKTDYDYFPEHAAGYVEDDHEVLNTGIPKTVVERIRHSNGELHWAETYKSPVTVDGEVIGTVGYARDISDQISLHKEVLKKELEFVELLESLPLAIVRYDRQCVRTFNNAHHDSLNENLAEPALGKTPSERWYQSLVGLTGQEFQEILENVMDTGQAKSLEMRIQHDDKSSIYFFNILPEKNSKGEVIGALTLASDITENSRNRQRIEHLAYHDALTDLPNRTLLNDRVEHAIRQAKRYAEQFGVLFLDLDNFKSINDTLGHAVGDQLLIEVSRRLSMCMREYDTVARMGGDEFSILVTDIKKTEDLASLAAHIIKQFELPFKVDNTDFFITVSMGIACYPQDGDNVADLLRYADSAMYFAKKNGGNAYHFYANELTVIASGRLKVETLLRYALSHQEFELYYQPIISLVDQKIVGAEALIRWHSAELGFVLPEEFIPVAEERGFIVEIGSWALESAFNAAVKWNVLKKIPGEIPLVISVNISSRQLMQQDFVAIVLKLLNETGCQPTWVKFEITESLLLQESKTVKDALYFLNELGIRISIDDFGTGHSALAYLNKFTVSEIKIDRSFIQNITTDENHALLVKSIIAMGISLNKTLIAEGIETEEQSKLIYDLGCNMAQGFLFSPPVTASEFEAMIADKVSGADPQ
ncbi:MAG TPA: EAL domain-containing protein [Methylotenera sp.]|nr:EAL domain-containing protein [Methylotenera sp.]